MKTNIVIFEMNPEVLDVFRVPESAIPESVLWAIVDKFFNVDEVTDEDWENFEVVNNAISNEARESNGVTQLTFPFVPMPGEIVFRVSMAM